MLRATQPAYVNDELRQVPVKPWRKVHLDFHNSQHIPSIGEAFDADEFGDTLVNAYVDGIVVFAKDMHGYFYYPSQYGPVHKGLSFDLLGAQVKACRDRGIKVYAYYCVTWDNYLAEHHPEWLVVKRDRTTYLPKFDETPRWTALCLTNDAFVNLVLDHSREVLERHELDGIWYDMPLPIGGECFCRNCLAALQDAGKDPFDVGTQRQHKQDLLVGFMRRAHDLAQEIRPGTQVDQNNQTRFGLAERAPFMGNIDIEALPTAAGWGYYYFPTTVRYARNFGTSVYGLTGRFHRSWADFGGLKHPHQLQIELSGIVAQGAHCGIGDQAPPHGRLDPAVYQTIGHAFARIKALEPFLDGAAPVTEAAIVASGHPLDHLGRDRVSDSVQYEDAVYGFTKLLTEAHVQFDVVEPDVDLERYRLLLLPENLCVDRALADRLSTYLREGGAIIASAGAATLNNGHEVWAESLGLEVRGPSPFTPAYLTFNGTESSNGLWEGLPAYEFALYEGALQLAPSDSSVVRAHLGEPLFQRNSNHYTSHQQTPFDHETNFAAIALADRLAVTAFPIGSSYYRQGYWIYREIFQRLVRAVLPRPLIDTDAPSTADVTLTHQQATSVHSERWLVHLVNFSASRRSPAHVEYHEDSLPLRDVRVSLAMDSPVARAYLAASNTGLNLRKSEQGWNVVVPRIDHDEIVVFELDPSSA